MENEKTVLVTGGSGFIGVETCKQLVDAGYTVINIDKKKKEIAGVTQYPFDISNSQVKGIIALTRPDAIIHLAAEHEVERSVTEPSDYYWNNVANTIALLNHAVEAGVKKFIFASSGSVYGNRTTTFGPWAYRKAPFSERENLNPLSPYSKSKMIIEGILPDYEAAYGMKFVILRHHNVAGASKDLKHGYVQKPAKNLIPSICKAITHDKTLSVTGNDYDTSDGTCSRDYTHLVDAARAHLDALTYLETKKSDTFNIGTGLTYTVLQVFDKFEKVIRKKPNYEIVGRRIGDPTISCADIEKAKTELSWLPQYTIDDIILDAYNWELKQK